MCNINRDAEAQLLTLGLNLITKAVEASVTPTPSSDVLASATTAYQQGKITKSQFMAVIDALDEQTYKTRAYAEPSGNSWNREYLEAKAYLDQYRR
jgi:tRNA A37 threonylcarbamoyladenosine dehydratase